MAQRTGEIRPVLVHLMLQPFLPIEVRARELLDLFLYDLARPLLCGEGKSALDITAGVIVAQPVGQRNPGQAGQFAQSIRPADLGDLCFATRSESPRLETQQGLLGGIATRHDVHLVNGSGGILNEKLATMFHIVLYQPEIPPNTGNVIRLAANTGCTLHLVRPLGFDIDDRSLRRAGLDYAEFATMRVHDDWNACGSELAGRRLFALSTKGTTRHDTVAFAPGDAFVFGRETAGLPADMLTRFPADRRLRLPMVPGNRSLNLSNAVAVLVFEAWRQQGFAGGQ